MAEYSPEPSPKTTAHGRWGCAVVAVVLMFFFGPMLLLIPGVFISILSIHKAESAMQRPEVFEPVGRTLALYCQSQHPEMPEYLSSAWLPEELNRIRRGSAWVREHEARISLGGGFHTFGYHLVRLTNASTEETNAWELSMHSDGRRGKHLQTIHLRTNERLSREQLLSNVIRGINLQLSSKPRDEKLHQEKIGTWLRFGQVGDARSAARAMLAVLPDEWWPVLTNALIMAEERSFPEAESFIRDWVQRKPSFDRYMDLTYFHQLTGHPDKAAAAMIESTRFNANARFGHRTTNAEHRGYTAAFYAYESGRPDAAIALIDHLLNVTVIGDYARGPLRRLRTAAVRAEEHPGFSRQHTRSSEIHVFDPFAEVDIEKLLQRKIPSHYKNER